MPAINTTVRTALWAALLLAVSTLPTGLAAQAGSRVAAQRAYASWLDAYIEGKILLQNTTGQGRENLKKFRRLCAAIARAQDLDAAKLLWLAAVVTLPDDMDKHVRLQARLGTVRYIAKQWMMDIDDPAVDTWLLDKAFRDMGKSGSLSRMTALDILGGRGTEGIAEKILARINNFPIPERIEAVLALERSGNAASLPALLKMLKEKDPNLRISVVQAICASLARYSDETIKNRSAKQKELSSEWTPTVMAVLAKQLVKEKIWQVKTTIIDGLVRTKNRQAIPVLIDGLRKEHRKGRSVNDFVVDSYHDALVAMTGMDLSRGNPALWVDFWSREGSTFRLAPAGTKKKNGKKPSQGRTKYVKYFNLDIRSKRVLFIIDFSGSMSQKVSLTDRYAGGRQHIKYELVKRELERVVRSLPKDAVCNVVFFNHAVSVWRLGKNSAKPALVKMSDENKSDLLHYIMETNPSGSTNLYGSLKTALAMGERGAFDKYYKTAYDTMFLLSDGAPTSGETTDTNQILAEVRKINKLRRIKINTIVFGDETNNIEFMRQLAEQNSGKFILVR